MVDRRYFLAATAAGLGVGPLAGQDGRPGVEPREAGFDAAKLAAVQQALAGRNTKALLVVKGGRTVLEWYAPGRTASMTHHTASMAKALVGGTSLLVALSDSRMRGNDRAAKHIPAWRDDPVRSKITIRHLATHTSGLEDSSVPGVAHPNEPGWKGRFWRRNDPDPFTIALRETPVLFPPGTSNQYSNPGIAALGYAVTASLRNAPQADVRALLRERVMGPLGVPEGEWSIGYDGPSRVDGMDLYANWGGANFTPRATARVAEWMMRGGEWNGTPLVSRTWVRQVLRYAGMPLPPRAKDAHAPGSGLGWYTNFDSAWPAVPRDAFAGAGAGHQVVLAVPSLDLVVVRNGSELAPESGQGFWTQAYREIFAPLMAALGDPAKPAEVPYPRSRVIRSVGFAPVRSIVRQAVECDNWPMTWADDGDLYTSYGDGMGFEPHRPEKLSMGFARVEGGPDGFRGVNIPSPTGDRTGEGAAGAKASGMLMVDGVLYLWVRNVKNSRIAWSEDHARTWQWGFTLERGFGSPCFLNFGRNYAQARDGYVYTYSQAGASAYETDDGVLLARAPKGRLRERGQWQFYTGGAGRLPGWTADLAAARPVFRFPGHCQRVDAVYHAASKRYLLAVSYGHTGGWGLFDAPEPWGPWSVAFHTEYWGLGETHGYRLPAKWISEDGRSMALVFSGLVYDGVSYDAFCVRGMEVEFG